MQLVGRIDWLGQWIALCIDRSRRMHWQWRVGAAATAAAACLCLLLVCMVPSGVCGGLGAVSGPWLHVTMIYICV